MCFGAVVCSLLALTSGLAISHSEGNDLSGEVPDALFALLCGLDRFDLHNNGNVDGGTLAGHLAISRSDDMTYAGYLVRATYGLKWTNLKDETKIDASGKGLRGIVYLNHVW